MADVAIEETMRITTTPGELNDTAVRPAKQVGAPAHIEKTATPHVKDSTPAANVSVSARAHGSPANPPRRRRRPRSTPSARRIRDGTFQVDCRAIAKRLVDGG